MQASGLCKSFRLVGIILWLDMGILGEVVLCGQENSLSLILDDCLACLNKAESPDSGIILHV
jgi:hypothetical protein